MFFSCTLFFPHEITILFFRKHHTEIDIIDCLVSGIEHLKLIGNVHLYMGQGRCGKSLAKIFTLSLDSGWLFEFSGRIQTYL